MLGTPILSSWHIINMNKDGCHCRLVCRGLYGRFLGKHQAEKKVGKQRGQRDENCELGYVVCGASQAATLFLSLSFSLFYLVSSIGVL